MSPLDRPLLSDTDPDAERVQLEKWAASLGVADLLKRATGEAS